ncbi:hypothetical protein GEMRC1_006755 [Eukaryota sp. GEM-RC1]
MNEVFNVMSLVAVVHETAVGSKPVGRKVFCVHGGIPRPIKSNWRVTWDKIKQLPKSIDPAEKLWGCATSNSEQYTLMNELLWNDVQSEESESNKDGFADSDRGPGCYTFNNKAIEKFCQTLGFSAIVRGHQACQNGVEMNGTADYPVITVFSTSRDHFGTSMNPNQCGTVLISQSGELFFISGEVCFPKTALTPTFSNPLPPSNRIVCGFYGESLFSKNSSFLYGITDAISAFHPENLGFVRVDPSSIVLPLLDIYAAPDAISHSKLRTATQFLEPLTKLLLSFRDLTIDFNSILVTIPIPQTSFEILLDLSRQLSSILQVDVEPRRSTEIVLFKRSVNREVDDEWGERVHKGVVAEVDNTFPVENSALTTEDPKFIGITADVTTLLT